TTRASLFNASWSILQTGSGETWPDPRTPPRVARSAGSVGGVPGASAGGAANAGRWRNGGGPDTTGTTSVAADRSTDNVPADGGGQTFGQSAPARSRRIRWPASKTHEVASSSIVTGYGSPGASGSGRSCDDRCVRFNKPRDTSAEVPSGKTSQSFADRN